MSEVAVVLDPSSSVIVQAYWMRSRDFDRIKDKLITPALSEDQSIVLFGGAFEFVTKAPVWMHAVTWIPLCVYAWVVLMVEHTLWTFSVFVFAAFVAWPLTEYLLHRFAFHFPVAWADGFPHFVSGPVNVFRLLLHTVHHAHPKDKLRIVTPLAMSIPIAVLLYPTTRFFESADAGYAWSTGMTMGYVAYDLTHYYMHFGKPWDLPEWLGPIKPWANELFMAHANHHYANEGYKQSFGVGHTLWDHVFGTNNGKKNV
jgi:sterol desaturase/sphingolipid hydroxylase (fatty acid hydroxylase superfamily)